MTNLVTFPGLGLSFEINRVAFSIGGIAIYWYGIMIAVGIMLAMVFAFRHCAEFGIDGDTMVDVIVVGVVMATLQYLLETLETGGDPAAAGIFAPPAGGGTAAPGADCPRDPSAQR